MTSVNNIKYEGFWKGKEEQDMTLQTPLESFNKVDINFINKLDSIMELVKSHIFYNGTYCEYAGDSLCRICNNSNGCGEYKIAHGNITFCFPSGLIHYYKDHNVHPSNDFKNWVTCVDLTNIIAKPNELWTLHEQLKYADRVGYKTKAIVTNLKLVFAGLAVLSYSN
jgi:hypothetical protein